MFSRCSVRIVPFVDVFLMPLWEEVNSMSSYSAIFSFSPLLLNIIFHITQNIPVFLLEDYKNLIHNFLLVPRKLLPRLLKEVIWEESLFL